MKIALGNDHCGFGMKGDVKEILTGLNCEVLDFGCHSADPVDFPDISGEVCEAVLSGRADRGIMICGTGVGASIAANKIPGIRASVCHDTHSAHQCVEHDDVNVMCIGAQLVGPWLVADLIPAFIRAEFDNTEDVRRRVDKLREMEIAYAKKLLGQSS